LRYYDETYFLTMQWIHDLSFKIINGKCCYKCDSYVDICEKFQSKF